MIKGHIDINFLTDDMLHEALFKETHHIEFTWQEIGLSKPKEKQESAIVHQSFGSDCPEWAHRIKDMFSNKIEHSMVTINLIKPGFFIPPHKDVFLKLHSYAKENNIDLTNKEAVRINLFLQDHKIGHFFEMENEVCMNYKKGDYAIIRLGKIHSVINIGNENRYTLQVSGFADKDTFL